MKEIFVSPEISNHDLLHKINNVVKILEKGRPVKFSMKMNRAFQRRIYDSAVLKTNFIGALEHYLTDESITITELAPIVNHPFRVLITVKGN